MGISSSELSLFAYCDCDCDCDFDLELCADGGGFDSARPCCDLEGPLLRPDLSDDFLVRTAEWRLDAAGVGEAAEAIMVEARYTFTIRFSEVWNSTLKWSKWTRRVKTAN